MIELIAQGSEIIRFVLSWAIALRWLALVFSSFHSVGQWDWINWLVVLALGPVLILVKSLANSVGGKTSVRLAVPLANVNSFEDSSAGEMQQEERTQGTWQASALLLFSFGATRVCCPTPTLRARCLYLLMCCG